MKYEPFGRRTHGLVDYGFVAAQFLVPRLMRLSPRARGISYAFGAFQGIVNALTAQPYGAKPAMSLRTHGKLETPLLPAIIAVPLFAGALKSSKARKFFISFFVIACVNYLLTDYNADQRRQSGATKAKKRSLFTGAADRNPHHQLNQ